MKTIESIKFWVKNARYHALAQSFWAAVVAICMAFSCETFNLKLALIALIGVLLAHLSINLLDDYFDYKSGSVEKRNELENIVRTGKCAYLKEGVEPKQILVVAGIFGLLAMACGGYLYFQRGLSVTIIATIAVILGFFYSAPPLKLSYRGLGEVTVGLMFGPLLMFGVFFCATATMDFQLILVSMAIGALVTNILYVHSIMDKKADLVVGKNTLAVLLKAPLLQGIALVFFAIFPYWLVWIGFSEYNLPKAALFVYLTLPLTIVLLKFMYEYLYNKKKVHTPRWWMGQMEQWERINDLGIGWFMIRWYLARNIMIFFSAILCVVYILRG